MNHDCIGSLGSIPNEPKTYKVYTKHDAAKKLKSVNGENNKTIFTIDFENIHIQHTDDSDIKAEHRGIDNEAFENERQTPVQVLQENQKLKELKHETNTDLKEQETNIKDQNKKLFKMYILSF